MNYETYMYCHNCGTKIATPDAICPECGQKHVSHYYNNGEVEKAHNDDGDISYDHNVILQNGLYKYSPYMEGYAIIQVTYIQREIYIQEEIDGLKVLAIANDAFKVGRQVIKKIVFPKTVEKIGKTALQNMVRLESVNIPLGIKCVPSNYLSGSNKIEEMVIPRHVEQIDTNAFCGCESLERVIILNDNIIVEKGAFNVTVEYIYGYKYPVNKLDGTPDYRYNMVWSPVGVDDKRPILIGNLGSTAESYAKKYGYRFGVLD